MQRPRRLRITVLLAEVLLGCFVATVLLLVLGASVRPLAFIYQGY